MKVGEVLVAEGEGASEEAGVAAGVAGIPEAALQARAALTRSITRRMYIFPFRAQNKNLAVGSASRLLPVLVTS